MRVLPVSAVIPTRNRPESLRRTLESLWSQEVVPSQLVVVDGSETGETRECVAELGKRAPAPSTLVHLKAERLGAAIQRNQGVAHTTQPWIWFLDDDIIFEPECVIRLWDAARSDASLGGVNALISNQRYQPPGTLSRLVFRLMAGSAASSYAGRVLGPAVNLLPEDDSRLPEVVPVEWLNTTCTLYRREALPTPPFDSVFTGYSLMEDLTLSLRVGTNWKLANARTARIFHDSQPGSHKQNVRALAAMELVNRHYVMTKVLNRRSWPDYLRLLGWELFQLASLTRSANGRAQLGATLRGKGDALRQIRSKRASAT